MEQCAWELPRGGIVVVLSILDGLGLEVASGRSSTPMTGRASHLTTQHTHTHLYTMSVERIKIYKEEKSHLFCDTLFG